MSAQLLPCPFCAGPVRITSNRDWHKLTGDHTPDCVFDEDYVTMVPANNDSLEWLVAAWNRRAALASQGVAAPAGWALVPLAPTPTMLLAAGYRASAVGASTTGHEAWAAFLSAAPQPPAVKEAEPGYSACCDTPHLCNAVRRCTAKDVNR